MAPSPAGTVFCIRIPLFLTREMASFGCMPPAALIAQYSPRLSPAVTSGVRPLFSISAVIARQAVTMAA